jgi:hypothetical protein
MSKDEWIQSTIRAAKHYEASGIFGTLIGQMTYGAINKFPKSLAMYAWGKSVQNLAAQNVAAINALTDVQASGDMPDSYINYGSLGACPYNALDIANEIAAAPTITSISPTNGAAGTVVTINGSNFTGTTAVTFNGVNATSFTVVNANTITAVCPTGFICGHLSVTNAIGMVISQQAYVRQ